MGGEQIVRLNADRVTWRRVDDELVVLDLVTSSYLSVNETGTAMWDLLDRGAPIGDLVASVLDTFEVDEATVRSDVEEFLADLGGRGLLAG